VIVGENERDLGALLLLSDKAKAMADNDRAQALTQALAAAGQSATGSASRVCRAAVLSQEPSFEKGEITEKGSLNQRAMRAHHADLIDDLYQNRGEAIVLGGRVR
jgi:feruloyl-CoA synthase